MIIPIANTWVNCHNVKGNGSYKASTLAVLYSPRWIYATPQADIISIS